MKRIGIIFVFSTLFNSCSTSFESFYNAHRTDVGTTSFQVPRFMKAVLSALTPETKALVKNISDFKYITFNTISEAKRTSLIAEMNAVTKSNYTDMFRKNEVEETRIISVKEDGVVVTDAIIFNSNGNKTSAYYLKGRFDPEKIKSFSDETTFNTFSEQLIQSYSGNLSPSFNPNN